MAWTALPHLAVLVLAALLGVASAQNCPSHSHQLEGRYTQSHHAACVCDAGYESRSRHCAWSGCRDTSRNCYRNRAAGDCYSQSEQGSRGGSSTSADPGSLSAAYSMLYGGGGSGNQIWFNMRNECPQTCGFCDRAAPDDFCGGLSTVGAGSHSYVYYGSGYSDAREYTEIPCTWTVHCTGGHPEFAIRDGVAISSGSSARVYDGGSTSSSELAHFTGSRASGTARASGSRMMVTFRPSGSRTHSNTIDATVTCRCNDNYFGSDCSVHCVSSSTCSGHGTCQSAGTCDCNRGYYGRNCGSHCLASSTCSGHGHCSSDGSCDCDLTYYGSNCATHCTDAETCNSQGSSGTLGGSCNPNGTCTCVQDFHGSDCSVHCGQCGHNGQWSLGPECKLTECNTDSGGICSATGVCSYSHCTSNFYGDTCDTFCSDDTGSMYSAACARSGKCIGLRSDMHHCNGHGSCSSDGTCECGSMWSGSYCDTPFGMLAFIPVAVVAIGALHFLKKKKPTKKKPIRNMDITNTLVAVDVVDTPESLADGVSDEEYEPPLIQESNPVASHGFCSSCGTPCSPAEKFCDECGHEL